MGLNHKVQVIQYSPKWFLKGLMEVSKINKKITSQNCLTMQLQI